MANDITANAMNAANTPANGAPEEREARRQAITRDLVGGNLSATDRRARLDELRRLTTDDAVLARQDRERTEAEANRTPPERELADLKKNPKLYEKTDPDQPMLVARLRQLLAASETADERAARTNATPEERRAQYGVGDPSLPKPWLDQYNEAYIGHESALYDVAHEHGLAAAQVRGLRDAAVELAHRRHSTLSRRSYSHRHDPVPRSRSTPRTASRSLGVAPREDTDSGTSGGALPGCTGQSRSRCARYR
jgi:hypothetical protein